MTEAPGRSIARLAADLAGTPELAGPLGRLGEAVGAAPSMLALGWATVDLERATPELAADLAIDGFDEAVGDPLLGARSVLGTIDDGPLRWSTRPGSPVRLIVLEPATEGRLAATLARRGEGPCALYVAIDGGLELVLGGAGLVLSRSEPGPLGPSRLVLGGPAWGPHLLLVRVPSPP